LIPRYKTLRGFQAPRKGGWDTHGLPVELEVERALGITSKPEIEQYGIAAFNARCRESVFGYLEDWRLMTDRIAFWVDMDEAYITFRNDYIESCWWILKQLWDQGLLYQGYKTTPHCPRCGTSLSSHEVALGYQDDAVDPSIFFKLELDAEASAGHLALERLRLSEGVPTYLLVWTTTPWTLPGNVAAALNTEADYVLVEVEQPRRQRYVLAEALLMATLREDYQVLARFQGRDLEGMRYQPLYPPYDWGNPVFQMEPVPPGGAAVLSARPQRDGERLSYPVITGDFVSLEDGTGIVHIAPAFGEDDFEIGKEKGLLFIQPVDLAGAMTFGSPGLPIKGKFVKEADPLIIRELDSRGLMERSETITHTYPFCWRCDTPLLYYVKTSWYARTTAKKDRLIAGNRQINWYPEYIKEGRFGNWLENNVDWALSRERYWGTPLPIWRCEGCGEYECIGSVAELQGKPGYQGPAGAFDLHRPAVDEPTFTCPQCGGTMRRIPELIDVWFDSGAMPVAQWHYPFEHQETFKDWFPADYICEAVDQTRGWFYSLHAISTLLFDEPCYRNVICLGLILDAKGEKMSKSRGNVVDPWEVLRTHGADALRWYLFTATRPGEARRFSVDLVGETVRKFLMTLWNTYSFFTIYASIDGWTPTSAESKVRSAELGQTGGLSTPRSAPSTPLDRWVLSRLHQLVQEVTADLDGYDPTNAGRKVQAFVDELSNWYVRRSRRRFWKSENDADKAAAYATLYECLVTLAKLLAPFTPFVAEELYQNLVRAVDPSAPESVHLCDYPVADPSRIDPELMEDTELVMALASLGRSARSKAGIKVRQPLGEMRVVVRPSARRDVEEEAVRRLAPQLADELNVKQVEVGAGEPPFYRVSVRAKPDAVGAKYGVLTARILAVFRDATEEEQREWYRRVTAGLPIFLRVEDTEVELQPEDVTTALEPHAGWALASEGGYTVGVSTALTPELREEGLARELVHRLQTLRRAAGFDIADTIVTYLSGDPDVLRVAEKHADYIMGETLTRDLRPVATFEVEPGVYVESQRVDGHQVTMGVRRLGD
ncbi:MAG: isoleucine--tRNA ligase, partial [Chloroflexi bacterium]|nr:isoleucine--tRNA ligase [Chloroflexota bacterium]